MSNTPKTDFVSNSIDDDSDIESATSGEYTNVTLAFVDGRITEVDETSSVNKIGGLASFSPVLSKPPAPESGKCLACGAFMVLLLQIDAPLAGDELSPVQNIQNRHAWNRVIYVFACIQKACQRKDGTVRVYRALRKVERKPANLSLETLNPFSKASTISTSDLGSAIFGGASNLSQHSSEPTSDSSLIEDLPVPFNKHLNRWSNGVGDVLPAQYLTTENEPAESHEDNVSFTANQAMENLTLQSIRSPPTGGRRKGPEVEANKSEISSGTANWTGEEFEKQKVSGLDDAFIRFQERVFVRAGGDLASQVLRYERGGTPLPFSGEGPAFDLVFLPPSKSSKANTTQSGSHFVSPSRSDKLAPIVIIAGREYSERNVKPCTLCGTARTFELQVMPQLVTCLGQSGPLKEDNFEIEWATVWCYFCGKDCGLENKSEMWAEEIAIVQFEEE